MKREEWGGIQTSVFRLGGLGSHVIHSEKSVCSVDQNKQL